MSLFDELYAKDEEETEELIPGILLGEVKENWDSAHPGMVKVKLLLGAETKDELDWMPVASPYAGTGHGIYLLPEIGSLVVVAFYMGHPQSPYVIGSLYSDSHVLPPEAADKDNTVKTLFTKGGNCILIRDDKKNGKITVKTKGAHTIELDDENHKISVQDSKGKNAVELDTDGGNLTFRAENKVIFKVGDQEMLVLDKGKGEAKISADNISAEAKQKLKLKGQNTALEGSSTNIKGQNIKAEAQASLELKGTASLKAQSSGIVQVKGSLLKLN